MSDNFAFNAPQFVDFTNEVLTEDENAEAYFEIDHEEKVTRTVCRVSGIVESERDIDQEFFSPMQSPYRPTNAEVCLKNHLRRSISAGNLLIVPNIEGTKEVSINNDTTDKRSTKQPRIVRRSRSASSRETINKLAQPKSQHGSNSSINSNKYISVAETVNNFEKGFRADITIQNSKPYFLRSTMPQSPALMTKQRSRPVSVQSKDEREKKEMEEAKKFKIKARPVNTKILYGPVKPKMPVERKPTTVVEPFNITMVKKVAPPSPEQVFEFHARPVPKMIFEPPKQPIKQLEHKKTIPQSPKLTKRLTRSKDQVDKCSNNKNHEVQQSARLTNTMPKPFSFEERDKQIQKRREELINKVLEEERKAREFHARPPPKHIFKSPQAKHASLNHFRKGSSESIGKVSNKSDDNIGNQTMFKARPAKVLHMKPFEPKKEERPLVEITQFELNTERRAKEREMFELKLKKEEEEVAKCRQMEEEQRKLQEREEIARIRKEAEHKAQPIRHFKELKPQPAKKCTLPVSPKFASTERMKNKENALIMS